MGQVCVRGKEAVFSASSERTMEMARFPRLLLQPVLVSVALAVAMLVPSLGVVHAGVVHPAVVRAVVLPRAWGGPTGTSRTLRLPTQAGCPSGHFLYADQGSSPNAVDEYQINTDCSLTAIGTIPTGSSAVEAAFGSNYIAVSKANGPCVFHSDTAGQVESFTVAANGTLTLASSITVADGVNYYAGDLRVSADGRSLYEANISANFAHGSQLNLLAIGKGCALKPLATATVSYPLYFSVAVASPTEVAAADYNGHLDFYTVSGSSIELLHSNMTEIAAPEGLSMLTAGKTTYAAIGQNALGAPMAEVDMVSNNVLQPFPGSPAQTRDPLANNGAYVLIDAARTQLIQSQEYADQLGLYGVKSNKVTWLNDTALPANDNDPSATAILGSELYVNNIFDASFNAGPITACVLGAGTITNCADAATRSGVIGVPEGIGIL